MKFKHECLRVRIGCQARMINFLGYSTQLKKYLNSAGGVYYARRAGDVGSTVTWMLRGFILTKLSRSA